MKTIEDRFTKETRNRVLVVICAVLLFPCAMAQVAYSDLPVNTSAPGAAFYSTSTMTGSGSTYSASPMLNTDGVATLVNTSAYTDENQLRPGPRRAPGVIDDPEFNQPAGDPLFPLFLFAVIMMVGIGIRSRIRKTRNTNIDV